MYRESLGERPFVFLNIPSQIAKGVCVMTLSERFSYKSMSAEQSLADDAQTVDVISLQVLAQEAAEGRRGAAWQLLHWIKDNDSRAVVAVNSLDDDRLVLHLLEWIAQGTWAGKPFIAPASLRSPISRMHLHIFFQPFRGVNSVRVERVLIRALYDDRPALRQTAANVLGSLGSVTVVPALIEALNDPVYVVQFQVVKALGHIKASAAVPALLDLLQHADEQLGSQIFTALAQIGSAALPALIEMSKENSVWLRWHCVRALGEIHDSSAVPVLVQALADTDQSVAWMAAKELVPFGQLCVMPVLRLLITTEVTPWLVETASYVLDNSRDNRLGPYVRPVIRQMHDVGFRIGTMLSAQKALTQLEVDGLKAAYAF
jgi:hypothetical protein